MAQLTLLDVFVPVNIVHHCIQNTLKLNHHAGLGNDCCFIFGGGLFQRLQLYYYCDVGGQSSAALSLSWLSAPWTLRVYRHLRLR